ncbi:hypothetical protein SASPL_150356 [Salvia splendens]|uniref:Uncharacterized protein n=1 Tax=Salvia splendens TaxID=180675 RepID=A0A8X8W5W7_SALSN|nr:hypothetical protein SASPL_150356 [Salvia splendens]
MPTSDSRYSAAAAHRQVVHPPLRLSSPRRSSTSSSQIVAAATPEGVYGGLIAELSEARKVDAVAEVVREMM